MFKTLESLSSVFEARSYEEELQKAEKGGNHCLGDICLGDGNLVVGFVQVNFLRKAVQPAMQSLRDCMRGNFHPNDGRIPGPHGKG
jgi:hypothetical protein